jgi:predicted aldo/keto reductase-like oxidoreductase
LKQTGAGYFDYYLLHNFGGGRSRVFDDFDMWSFVKEKKEEGLIKHIGFSAHTTPEEVESIITKHPEMEFVQLQINYADWDDCDVQARECYEAARKHDIPVIVMEPVKGGMLATPPPSVEKIFREADPKASNAEWALRYAADLEGIITVLSGMSNMEQMEENIRIFKNIKALSPEEREVIARAQKALQDEPVIPCTTCDYCAKVCPENIGISGSFMAMNELILYDNYEIAKSDIGWNVNAQGHKPATECIKCGACEEACPQNIKIISELEKVTETFYSK